MNNMADNSTLSNEMREALDEATGAMDHHAVSYALIGGIAASYRSQPRFTKDIDFLVQVPQIVLPRLLADLDQDYIRPVSQPEFGGYVFDRRRASQPLATCPRITLIRYPRSADRICCPCGDRGHS